MGSDNLSVEDEFIEMLVNGAWRVDSAGDFMVETGVRSFLLERPSDDLWQITGDEVVYFGGSWADRLTVRANRLQRKGSDPITRWVNEFQSR